jgi:hypothetical protein
MKRKSASSTKADSTRQQKRSKTQPPTNNNTTAEVVAQTCKLTRGIGQMVAEFAGVRIVATKDQKFISDRYLQFKFKYGMSVDQHVHFVRLENNKVTAAIVLLCDFEYPDEEDDEYEPDWQVRQVWPKTGSLNVEIDFDDTYFEYDDYERLETLLASIVARENFYCLITTDAQNPADEQYFDNLNQHHVVVEDAPDVVECMDMVHKIQRPATDMGWAPIFTFSDWETRCNMLPISINCLRLTGLGLAVAKLQKHHPDIAVQTTAQRIMELWKRKLGLQKR